MSAEAGVYELSQLEDGDSMARRFGKRITGPFIRRDVGVYSQVRAVPETSAGSALYLMRGDQFMGRAVVDEGRVLVCGPEVTDQELMKATWALVAAEERPLSAPFQHVRGKMWQKSLPDLVGLSDSNDRPPRHSNVYIFEDKRQLPWPHSVHDEIDRYGSGRFSHWEATLYFSTSKSDDPNSNGSKYLLLIAAY
jgi:hypothetical protein